MIRLEKNGKGWKGWEEWQVYVNDVVFDLKEFGSKYDDEQIYFPDSSKYKLKITELSLNKFGNLPSELLLDIYNDDHSLGKHVANVMFCNSRTPRNKCLSYFWEIKLDTWKGQFNPFLIRDELIKRIKLQQHFSISEKITSDDDLGSAAIFFDLDFDQVDNYQELFTSLAKFLNNSFAEIEEELSIGGFSEKVVARFSFDSQAQQACLSYLNYFIDFLKDIGIQSHSEVKRSSENTIFSIIPDSKETSLQMISDALSFYLNLPRVSQDISSIGGDPLTELKVERLKAEIDKLKSSLRTSEAIIKYQEHLLVDGSNSSKLKEPIDALSDIYVDTEKKDTTEFLNGGIKLGVFKKGGVEFHWGTLLNYFKPK
ncbi:hypothetical protein SOPP22_19420 [Shewanella sp. OPT22]|nr:hypothetical protein SOPP22_19420 [Shewanella sp. OPT22]